MKIKPSELTGAALDWAVAKADQPVYSDKALISALTARYDGIGNYHEAYSPSTNWEQGGPIKEQQSIRTQRTFNNGIPNTGSDAFKADLDFLEGVLTLGEFTMYGSTELEATMRCYVASKLGDEVDIPEELC